MALYQQPLRPRFYINDFEYILKSNAHWQGTNIIDTIMSLSPNVKLEQFYTLPVAPTEIVSSIPLYFPYTIQNPFVMLLGHSSLTTDFTIYSDFSNPDVADTAVNNAGSFNINEVYNFDGWSLIELTGLDSGYGLGNISGNYVNEKIGSFILGNYFDLPASPESITMKRDVKGIKKVRTMGGNDLVGYKYMGNLWGDLGAWELSEYGIDQKLSAKGLRSWEITFNVFNDEKLFPKVGNLTNYETDYEDDADITKDTLLESTSFYSQVIQKVGNKLPFIFNPNGGGSVPNNNNDMFAICKFQDKFEFDQIGIGIYQYKMKIKEIK